MADENKHKPSRVIPAIGLTASLATLGWVAVYKKDGPHIVQRVARAASAAIAAPCRLEAYGTESKHPLVSGYNSSAPMPSYTLDMDDPELFEQFRIDRILNKMAFHFDHLPPDQRKEARFNLFYTTYNGFPLTINYEELKGVYARYLDNARDMGIPNIPYVYLVPKILKEVDKDGVTQSIEFVAYSQTKKHAEQFHQQAPGNSSQSHERQKIYPAG